jgi:hypothetical protein
MTFNALIAVVGLTALLLLIAAGRYLRMHRVAGGLVRGSIALLLCLAAGGAIFLSTSLQSYQRLTAEQPAGTLRFTRIGYHQFNGILTYPSGESADFELRGDEWQVDARVLKWRAPATVLGFDAAYRLDRIGGRYTNIDDEHSLPRTVYALNPPEHVDLWALAYRYHQWLPWIDALYGSATFLPMADGASYTISVSPSGLVARPVNQPAVTAVGGWH